MKNREELVNLLSEQSIGCELGVFKGDFSKVLLDSKKFKKLYLVDIFSGNVESGDKNGNNIQIFSGDYLFDFVASRFKNEPVEIKRCDSISFLKSCEDNFFDFIYIDTNHQYQQTIDELEWSLKKIKNKGFICGHDYHQFAFGDLFRAVNFFAEKYNLQIQTTTNDGLNSYIFYIEKQ